MESRTQHIRASVCGLLPQKSPKLFHLASQAIVGFRRVFLALYNHLDVDWVWVEDAGTTYFAHNKEAIAAIHRCNRLGFYYKVPAFEFLTILCECVKNAEKYLSQNKSAAK